GRPGRARLLRAACADVRALRTPDAALRAARASAHLGPADRAAPRALATFRGGPRLERRGARRAPAPRRGPFGGRAFARTPRALRGDARAEGAGAVAARTGARTRAAAHARERGARGVSIFLQGGAGASAQGWEARRGSAHGEGCALAVGHPAGALPRPRS